MLLMIGSPAQAAPLADLAEIVARGRLMQRLDQAAWITTDDLMAMLPAERAPEVGGWVVTPTDAGLRVDYFGQGDMADRAIYSARIVDGHIVESRLHPADALPSLDRTAHALRVALMLARGKMARHVDWQACTPAPFNTIIVPPDRDGIINVYFMSAQVAAGEIPFGRHYRIAIGPDGTIRSGRAFAKSCLMLPAHDPDGLKRGGLYLTHLLDPQPTEVHMFEQIASGLPLYVMTTGNGLSWSVTDQGIARIDVLPEPVGPTI